MKSPFTGLVESDGEQTSSDPPVDSGVNVAGPPLPSSQPALSAGLFGYSGMSSSARVPPIRIILMLLFCIFAFGAAQVINGAASRLVRPRFAIPDGASALSNLALVTRVFDPGAVIAGFRLICILLISFAMVLCGDVPPGGAAAAWQLPSTPRQLFTPVLIGITNVGGFLPFMLLTSVSGVALWSGLLALYVLGPVLFGLLARGESRTPRKLAGIGSALLSAVLLALPSGSSGGESVIAGPEGDEGLPGWARFVLYLLTAALWGIADTSIAYVGRDTHLLHVTVLSSLGFGIVSLTCSAASYFLTVSAGGGTLTQGTASSGGFTVLFLGQGLGTLGWFLMAKLGKASEASAFLPVVCLYTALTAVFSVGFLGESLSAAGWCGIVAGCGGMLLIATSGPSPARPAGEGA